MPFVMRLRLNLLIFRLFLMIGGLMLMFAMWWAYFDRSEQHHHVKGVRPFVWGYTIILFCEYCCRRCCPCCCCGCTTHHAHISDLYMGVIVAVSVVLYTSCIWILYEFQCLSVLSYYCTHYFMYSVYL